MRRGWSPGDEEEKAELVEIEGGNLHCGEGARGCVGAVSAYCGYGLCISHVRLPTI